MTHQYLPGRRNVLPFAIIVVHVARCDSTSFCAFCSVRTGESREALTGSLIVGVGLRILMAAEGNSIGTDIFEGEGVVDSESLQWLPDIRYRVLEDYAIHG